MVKYDHCLSKMDQRTRYIVIGGVVLLFVAAVLITIFYLGRVYRSNSDAPQNPNTNPLTELPTIASSSASVTPSASSGGVSLEPSNTKIYAASGFTLNYPSGWGLLTCSNSQNFEFDPTNGADVKNVVCDVAVKPVTVLVTNRLNCTGETINIGEKKVVKSKVTASNGSINYRWCVGLNGKGLDITHRISSFGSRAASKDDFSNQVEQMINSLKVTPQGS